MATLIADNLYRLIHAKCMRSLMQDIQGDLFEFNKILRRFGNHDGIFDFDMRQINTTALVGKTYNAPLIAGDIFFALDITYDPYFVMFVVTPCNTITHISSYQLDLDDDINKTRRFGYIAMPNLGLVRNMHAIHVLNEPIFANLINEAANAFGKRLKTRRNVRPFPRWNYVRNNILSYLLFA